LVTESSRVDGAIVGAIVEASKSDARGGVTLEALL
jgi:hypothetical protein